MLVESPPPVRAFVGAVKAGFIEVAAGVVITLKPAQQQ